MNSHQRRTSNRFWLHYAYLYNDQVEECFMWLHKNFGSCSFKTRRMPRWCWCPDLGQGPSFTMMRHGVEIYFRKKEDYAWFMLKWNR
jgi:hypothetical protein